MSFAHETKESLIAQSDALKHDCCRKCELYGILFAAGIFERGRIKLVTTCVPLAEMTVARLEKLFHVESNLYVTERKSGEPDERSSCKITIPQKKELERLYSLLKYDETEPLYSVKRENYKCGGCQQSFLRGIFLAAGTITDPDKSYHLEMSFTTSDAADKVAELLADCDLEPKRMTRKSEEVLYYKGSESIENFLAFIGANSAMFTIMNKKIERGIRSDANRIANSELANIGKTVVAAADQISAIRLLESSGALDRIPDELRATALLRLENPDATLMELAGLHTPPITKSGVNHRLKKLVEYAKTQ